MPLGAAQAQELNSCKILLAPETPPRGTGRDGGSAGPRLSAARKHGARRARPAPRCVPAAPRAAPGLRSAASRSRASARRPAPAAPVRWRRRQAPGADKIRRAPGRGRPLLRSGVERRVATGEPGRRVGKGRERLGSAARRGAANTGRGAPAAPLRLLSPLCLPLPPPQAAGRRPAAGRGDGAGARGRSPLAGRGGRALGRGEGRGRAETEGAGLTYSAPAGPSRASRWTCRADPWEAARSLRAQGGAGERGEKGGSQSATRHRGGGGRRLFAAAPPRLPTTGRARPPGTPVPHTLTLQIVLQIQHGGGRASAKGLLASGGSSLPIWRRRQQHQQLDSAKTTLAADGARSGHAAIGCPRRWRMPRLALCPAASREM